MTVRNCVSAGKSKTEQKQGRYTLTCANRGLLHAVSSPLDVISHVVTYAGLPRAVAVARRCTGFQENQTILGEAHAEP